MQIRSNIPSHYLEYPVNGPLMSHAVNWNQAWSEQDNLYSCHYHPHPELGLCLDGCGIFFVEDRVYPFSKGTVIYIPADMTHIEENSPKRKCSWDYLWIDERLFGENNVFGMLSYEVFTQDRSCRRLFDMLFGEVSDGQSDTEMYIGRCTAFAHMMERTVSATRPEPSDNEARQMIVPAVTYIADHYSEDISVSKLARESNLSESTLRRTFSRVIGLAPYEYICSVRLAAAENLLIHTDLSILEISISCGFNSLSSFNRQFKKANGVPPSFVRADSEK